MRAFPEDLGALRTAEDRLIFPVETDGTTKSATCRPFEVRAERARRRVHEQHTLRHRCRHDSSTASGCVFPNDPCSVIRVGVRLTGPPCMQLFDSRRYEHYAP
ncbi:hypothetical protein PLANTIT3_61063 [Plantibacter sp. T3]|nr:hypothetical protein PLANTIT3_61063 [Plantibacter sp. T3]